jgi:predicted nucleic acid-binding protein
MKLAIDTNKYKDLCEGDSKTVQTVRFCDQIAVPFIVLGELRAGFRLKSSMLTAEKQLSQFLNTSRVHVIYADEETTFHYSHLVAQMRKQGTPIPTNDLWIAALAIQHRLPLLTRDKDFLNIPQLTVLN